ncbi:MULTISPECIES: AraC family transcriptional regulator [Halomonadaceae]|uniref:Helix-turn-helix transcriptional regulator n=2 Tax=Vreelandella TaxID=3137766 RepID=A0A7Z0RWD9_9GAMM|nr:MULTISPECIES: AraC family transcriptional regulator [unclassified Halomonas]AJY51236.1 transcriptional regulator with only HTH domain, AraC family [Halomonas sp. KO116]NYS76139.1 helix-turn-helix transcriptional regulator [Halomonas glaciei]
MGELTTEQEISAADLQQLSATLVKRQRLEAPCWDQRSAPLAGRMWVSELEPGLQLRLADIQDRFGLKSQAILPAGIKIALVIEGTVQVRYGAFEVQLGPQTLGTQTPHTGLLVALPSATSFMRLGQAGAFERTLTLSLTPHWLARYGHSDLMAAPNGLPHLHYWAPSPGLIALASQLFTPQQLAKENVAHRLQLLGFAMTLAGEALASAQLSSTENSHSPTPPHQEKSDRRLATLMSLIDNGEAKRMTQADLASYLGMSLSNLQRRFYRQYGESLGSFLRHYHLSLARHAIAQGVSIETAASLAGYASAANFATAFKREFSTTPSHFRQTSRSSQRVPTIRNKHWLKK